VLLSAKTQEEATSTIATLDVEDTDIESFLRLGGKFYHAYPAMVKERGQDFRAGTVKVVVPTVSPVSVMALEDGRLRPFLPGPVITRRQDKPRVYARNGPAVLAVRVSVLERGHLYGDDCRPLIMTPADSVDIDDQHDFEYAEFLLNRTRH
jgi:CMP-N-acetylneuraminic acid synthetase